MELIVEPVIRASPGPTGTGDSHPPRIEVAGLSVCSSFHAFIGHEVLEGTNLHSEEFWAGLASIVGSFAPRNAELLATRKSMQDTVDDWLSSRPGASHDAGAFRALLTDIGYLVPNGAPFEITSGPVDAEIGAIPAPQLLVAATDTSAVTAAIGARWGSLLQAVLDSGIAAHQPVPTGLSDGFAARSWVLHFLDEIVPLRGARYREVVGCHVTAGELVIELRGNGYTSLVEEEVFVGFSGPADAPHSVLLRHHRLHLEIVFAPANPRDSATGEVADVHLEAALSVIIDMEDLVVATDPSDKEAIYRTWLRLMRDEAPGDRVLVDPRGYPMTVPASPVMAARIAGLHTTTDAVMDGSGQPCPEGLLDAYVIATISLHDLRSQGASRNSRTGSVYLVEPKLHGPDEVEFVDAVFGEIERLFDLPAHTIKLGLLDEEFRTSVNLGECIRAARHRIAMINAGAFDRLGSEINVVDRAGPVLRTADLRQAAWAVAYEQRVSAVALDCGFAAGAGIGKGMWSRPDDLREMLRTKGDQLRDGATCAWVASPVAAILHATHYHRIDVLECQRAAAQVPPRAIDDLLQIPVLTDAELTVEERQHELDRHVFGLLSYVSQFVDRGMGFTALPDIDGVRVTEDRARCRVSAQHIANWVRHGVLTENEVAGSLRRIAGRPLDPDGPDPASTPHLACSDQAYLAAVELIERADSQPSGYADPVLRRWRNAVKTLEAAGPVDDAK